MLGKPDSCYSLMINNQTRPYGWRTWGGVIFSKWYWDIRDRVGEHIGAETKWLPFCRPHFQIYLFEWHLFLFDSNVIQICSYGSNLQYASIDSDNGLASNNWQTITYMYVWTKDGLVYWLIYASLPSICEDNRLSHIVHTNRLSISNDDLSWGGSHWPLTHCSLVAPYGLIE